MRTGSLPWRGSGVTVFVTNASRLRATSGAVSASRQPLALSSRMEHWSFHAEALELPVDPHGAAPARAVAACHRGLPGQLRVRAAGANGLEHRLRPAGQDVETVQVTTCYEDGVDHDLRTREELGCLRVPGAAEAEHRRG